MVGRSVGRSVGRPDAKVGPDSTLSRLCKIAMLHWIPTHTIYSFIHDGSDNDGSANEPRDKVKPEMEFELSLSLPLFLCYRRRRTQKRQRGRTNNYQASGPWTILRTRWLCCCRFAWFNRLGVWFRPIMWPAFRFKVMHIVITKTITIIIVFTIIVSLLSWAMFST